MRDQAEQHLESLDDSLKRALLGVLVEQYLTDEDEEIVFRARDGRPVAYFLPHDLRCRLNHARIIAELDHPDGIPSEDYVLEKSGITKQEAAPVT